MIITVIFTILLLAQRTYCCSLVAKSHADIKRDIVGKGFKRDLNTSIELKSSFDLMNCEVLIRETLPSGAYFDMNEINLIKKTGYSSFYMPEVVNVETPEYSSPKILAYVFSNLVKIDQNIYIVNISMPIHLRYHKPKSGTFETEATVEIPSPSMFISCDDEEKVEDCYAYKYLQPCSLSHKEQCDWIHIHSYSDKNWIEASIPVGDSDLTEVVIILTSFVPFFSMVLMFIYFYQKSKKSKEIIDQEKEKTT